MPSLGTEGNWPREGIIEVGRVRNVFVKAGAGVLPSLRMVAAITPASTSAAKAGGNTGNGTMGAITTAPNTPAGVYPLRITVAAANAGTFELKDPKGRVVATGTVAVAFSGGGLSFTLADGTTDFIVGDGFDLTVPETLWENYDNGASDGTEAAQGLLLDDVDASGAANVRAAVIWREGVLLDHFVTAEVSAHKAAGKTDLAALDFIFIFKQT